MERDFRPDARKRDLVNTRKRNVMQGYVDAGVGVSVGAVAEADGDGEMPSCSSHINAAFKNWHPFSDKASSSGSSLDDDINYKNKMANNSLSEPMNYDGHVSDVAAAASAAGASAAVTEEACSNVPHGIVDLQYQQFLIEGKRPFANDDGSCSMMSYRLNSEQNRTQNDKLKSQNTTMILYEFCCTGLLCDAVIFVEDAFFTVHTPIMCTCSSYFQATFAGGLNLRNPPKLTDSTQEIFIPQVSGAIMEELVKYAYLRQGSITNENVYEMLVTADYFGITGMMNRCKDFLISNFTPQNCVGTMIFASFRLMDDLYGRAREYVMRYFPQVMQESQDILQLELDEFYDIISDDNLNTRDEDLVWRMCLKWIGNDLNNRRQHVAHLMSGVRLGLMTAKCFMEEVKDHPLVLQCEEAKPLIVEAFKFMYDLDIVNSTSVPLSTPALAMPRLPHEIIFAIGGWSSGTATGCIETYDTRSDRWIVLPTDPDCIPRAYHGSVVIGFKIYCIGGYDGVDCFSKCHVYDLENNKWNEIAPMYYRRCYVSVTVHNDCIYAVGGYDGWHRLSSCERYDPTTNQWTKISPLLSNRSDAGCCTLNDKIYVVGGFNGQECLDTAEVYDSMTNQWTKIPVMSQRRSGVSCVAFRSCVYVVGGFNGTARLMCAERYDPQLGHWTPICDMSHPRSNFGLEIIDDMIFAVGGFDGISTISHTECYVAETNEWMEATNMNFVRSALTVSNVAGLPKRLNYMYKDRHRLVEERKQRLIANTIQRAVQVTITRQLVMNQFMNQPYHTQNNMPDIAASHILNPLAQQQSTASVAAAALNDPSILANAQQSQDEEMRDISASLFQQNNRINYQLQDDMLYNDRYFRR